MLIPLDIPPGVVKNGTPYQRKGRWEASNLVRWFDGAIRAIGGWDRRQATDGVAIPPLFSDPAAEAVRDTFAWVDLLADQHLILGGNKALYHLSSTGLVTDVTPAGAATSPKDSSLPSGYGYGNYGASVYGISADNTGLQPQPPLRWAFDSFGQLLLAQQRTTGPLYEMDPATLITTVVANAPSSSQDVVVTDQRIVMLIGVNGDGRRVQWSDQEDRNLWTAAVNNQAGDIDVQGQGKLLFAINVLQQVLIVGERDAVAARYVGPPYVFSFELVGRNCGAIAAEAVAGTDRFAAWWGLGEFWLFDGTLRGLPCPLTDFLADDVDQIQAGKIVGFTNQQYSEVWWLYQSVNSTTTEVDSYVSWNYRDNTWWVGKLDRTAGQDFGVINTVLMVSSTGEVYSHELVGVQVDGVPFVESAGIDMSNGERNSAVRYVYPDTEAFGDANMTIFGRQFPNSQEFSYGPYVLNNPTPTRAQGRELRFRFEGLRASFELGTMRVDLAPLGGGVR